MMNQQNDPKRPVLTQSFKDRASAERAFDTLITRGYKPDEIHVLMLDDTRKRLFSKDDEKTDMGNKALKGAGVGGMVGGAVGATVVGLAAVAATLTIPVLGLVIAGPIAGALAGGAAGATAGGALGLLVGAGIPEDRAKRYEMDLKEGSIVLGITPHHDDDARFFDSEWHGQTIPS